MRCGLLSFKGVSSGAACVVMPTTGTEGAPVGR